MTERWIGRSVPRVEDGRLLTGRGTFIDDHPPVANLRHAAIVRSPHAHARILGYDVSAALAMDGRGRRDHRRRRGRAHASRSAVGVTAPVHYYCAATDKVRFVGEPVAVVVARDRYLAEDAADRVVGRATSPCPRWSIPSGRWSRTRPILHEAVGTNLAGHRRLVYGDPDAGVPRGRRGDPRALQVPQVRLHAHRDLRRDRRAGTRSTACSPSGRTSWGRSSCTR